MFIVNNSLTKESNFFLSFLTLTPSRIPYVLIPNEANKTKYPMIDDIKFTFPYPSTPIILVTYGIVISGNNIVNIVLII